ncbi:MAG: hypothetical protein QM519_02305 [Bacteroidia bacterium]|nr:hypothetical protein [Bacteroidia bacterium]
MDEKKKRDVVETILRHKRPAVARVDVELAGGAEESLRMPTGRYRARQLVDTMSALGEVVGLRLKDKDGAVIHAMRWERAEAPELVSAPPPAAADATAQVGMSMLGLLAQVYRDAFKHAEAMFVQAQESNVRAMQVMSSSVEESSKMWVAARDREREVSAQEVELARQAAEALSGQGGSTAELLTLLPQLMPMLPMLRQMITGAPMQAPPAPPR